MEDTKPDREYLKYILGDAILSLCNDGLSYGSRLSIDGLLGITLDNEEVFLVKIEESLSTKPQKPAAPSTHGMRTRKRKSAKTHRITAKERSECEQIPDNEKIDESNLSGSNADDVHQTNENASKEIMDNSQTSHPEPNSDQSNNHNMPNEATGSCTSKHNINQTVNNSVNDQHDQNHAFSSMYPPPQSTLSSLYNATNMRPEQLGLSHVHSQPPVFPGPSPPMNTHPNPIPCTSGMGPVDMNSVHQQNQSMPRDNYQTYDTMHHTRPWETNMQRVEDRVPFNNETMPSRPWDSSEPPNKEARREEERYSQYKRPHIEYFVVDSHSDNIEKQTGAQTVDHQQPGCSRENVPDFISGSMSRYIEQLTSDIMSQNAAHRLSTTQINPQSKPTKKIIKSVGELVFPDPVLASKSNPEKEELIRFVNETIGDKVKMGERKKRGEYNCYTAEQRAKIGHYATKHGVSQAVKKFTDDHGKQISESTVRSMKKAYLMTKGETDEEVTALPTKERGRPLRLGQYDAEVVDYIKDMIMAGGTVTQQVVIAAAHGILMHRDRNLLKEYGGQIELTKAWAESFLRRIRREIQGPGTGS